jgi:hypothetical protein
VTDPTPPPSGGAPTGQKPEERAPTRHRLPSGFSTIRDIVSFGVGLLIIGNEVFIQSTADPAVIAVGMAMTGLPLVFGANEKKGGD